MDIDRVPQMNGVGREPAPVWPKSARQRRKPASTESAGDPENADTESEATEPQVEDASPSEDDAERTERSRINLMA